MKLAKNQEKSEVCASGWISKLSIMIMKQDDLKFQASLGYRVKMRSVPIAMQHYLKRKREIHVFKLLNYILYERKTYSYFNSLFLSFYCFNF